MQIVLRELVVLASIPGIGPARLNALIRHYEGTGGIFCAPERELLSVEGMDRRTARSILTAREIDRDRLFREAEDQINTATANGGRIVTLWDNDYPELLSRIPHPPSFLYLRGSITDGDTRSIAVVGTRQPTQYGSRVAGELSRDLVLSGFSIISGLARGVDTIAHQAALRSGGRTIAVIGSGLDVLYPPENRSLARAISARGAIVTEFPMGTQPDAVNFPRRNRIISGLSAGTLVIETGIRGGAMITASIALEQNREVFAIPAPVGEGRKSGTNLLIKEGRAKLIESVEDIIEELDLLLPAGAGQRVPTPAPQLSLFERRVFDSLSDDPLHIDRIAALAGMSAHETLVELLSLELKGLIRPLPGKTFRKT